MDEEDELLIRALEILQKRARGAASAKSVTVKEIFDKYEFAMARTLKSWRIMEQRLRAFVAKFGDKEAMSIRVLDWSDFRAEREREEIPTGKPGRTRRASTLNLELGVVKAMFNWAVGEGRIPHNPIAAAKRVKTRRHRETAPHEGDIEALLATAESRQRVVILCATDAGMRCSEICALSWNWIDRDARVIRLPNWACKNQRGGTVPLTTRLLDAIDAIPHQLRSPYVLTSPRSGAQFNRRTISRWFRDVADMVGVQATPADGRVVLHDCRHSFASNAARRGVRIEIVSEVLRHASLDQTRDYVQTSEADLAAAREIFEAGIARDRRRGPKKSEGASPAIGDREKNKG